MAAFWSHTVGPADVAWVSAGAPESLLEEIMPLSSQEPSLQGREPVDTGSEQGKAVLTIFHGLQTF